MTVEQISSEPSVLQVHSGQLKGALHATPNARNAEDWSTTIAWPALRGMKCGMGTALKLAEMERTTESISATMAIRRMEMGKFCIHLNCLHFRCSNSCETEANWYCYGGNVTTPDKCEFGPKAVSLNLTSGFTELTIYFTKPVKDQR